MGKAAAACGCLVPFAVQAQALNGADLALEASTDRRERGLSWSDGKPALSLSATAPATSTLTFDLEAATLRGSARHGGADVGLTLAPRYRFESGGWIFGAGVRGNVFVGRSGMSYVELVGDIEHTIGPARVAAGLDFAPSQDAIGGSNFHVAAHASLGVPGTPLTVYGGIGHTSGSNRDDPRTWRLRPGGRYTDHHVGIEHSQRTVSFGLRYSDTSIDAETVSAPSPYHDGHHGSRVLAYLRLTP